MDLALVEAARSGDEEAFASIVRGSADRLFVADESRDVGDWVFDSGGEPFLQRGNALVLIHAG